MMKISDDTKFVEHKHLLNEIFFVKPINSEKLNSLFNATELRNLENEYTCTM